MSEAPWLTIIGLGEDGPNSLCAASRQALDEAEIVIGPSRHLELLPDLGVQRVAWPVPFADGLRLLEGFRGRSVVALVSGDPFWFGAGSVISARLAVGEWRAIPGRSTFSLAAAHLGWPLELTLCLGLHAAPLERLRPQLAPGQRAIVLLRDGKAAEALAAYLCAEGFGETRMIMLEALGGPRARVTSARAKDFSGAFSHPIAVALEVEGRGMVLPVVAGISDAFFDTDGQMTKRPVRALALSALAPKPGETLWDIGGGSGSIGIEWCLAHPRLYAISIEPRRDRAARIRANADRFGLDRLSVVEGEAPDALLGLQLPQAVFIGGGLSEELIVDLAARLSQGTRLVAHAVTLESEALLIHWNARLGGDLLRIALAEAAPLGPRRGWSPSRAIVQWRVVL
ncbi:MAG: precorrin-6y C5,15-methyltransferase (decarboxylating) subunit CbiE [Proteobacteria bacterium]|nr:precorrin-6y C5,15-methyltransferase (decarboxylating) subunit CbiE [Pseudomonadota bacterium]